MQDINKGVTCQVDTCTHYVTGDKCNASYINVRDNSTQTSGYSSATNVKDTCCDTFRKK